MKSAISRPSHAPYPIIPPSASLTDASSIPPPLEISPKVLWPRLATTPDFYALLPWMEGSTPTVPSDAVTSLTMSNCSVQIYASKHVVLDLIVSHRHADYAHHRLYLPLLAEGKLLWRSLERYNPTIITGEARLSCVIRSCLTYLISLKLAVTSHTSSSCLFAP